MRRSPTQMKIHWCLLIVFITFRYVYAHCTVHSVHDHTDCGIKLWWLRERERAQARKCARVLNISAAKHNTMFYYNANAGPVPNGLRNGRLYQIRIRLFVCRWSAIHCNVPVCCFQTLIAKWWLSQISLLDIFYCAPFSLRSVHSLALSSIANIVAY